MGSEQRSTERSQGHLNLKRGDGNKYALGTVADATEMKVLVVAMATISDRMQFQCSFLSFPDFAIGAASH